MENYEMVQYLEAHRDNLSEAWEYLAFKKGVSIKRIRAIALEAGFRMRKERSDKGETSCPSEILDLIAARVRISIKKSAKNSFDINTSIKTEYDNLISEGYHIPVGYERICTLLRNMELDRKSLTDSTPFIRLDTPHVNHTHLFDITNCLQWHLEKGTAMKEEDLVWLYPNKVLEHARKRDKSLKLLRFVMIDHKSRAFYFQYFYTTGERAQDGAEFFYNAWRDKRELIRDVLGIDGYDGAYQFHGIPKNIYTDGGAIFKDSSIKNLMKNLGVEVLIHKTHNPRAKGMVERHMKIIGDNFESMLRRVKIETLEELNQFALDWCIEFNNKKQVSKTNYTRSQMWRNIKTEELTTLPPYDVYKALISKDEITRVLNGNGEFTYNGQDYRCSDPNFAGKKVVVQVTAKDFPALILHFNGYVEKAYPFDRDAYGRPILSDTGIIGERFVSHAKTNAEIMKEHIEQVAESVDGVTFTGNNDKRIAKPTLNNTKHNVKTKKENIKYLTPQGEVAAVENPYKPLTNTTITHKTDDKPINMTVSQAIKMLIAEYGSVSKENNKKLKELFPNGVPASLTATELFEIIINSNMEVDNAKLA